MTATDAHRIRAVVASDKAAVTELINDAARAAYRGVIPADCWHEPYMSASEFDAECEAGVEFELCEINEEPTAVMGLQYVDDVALIRHAYVAVDMQRQGLGSLLLARLRQRVTPPRPLLVGTWKAAAWAIGFYERNDFTCTDEQRTATLLGRYWRIPARQIETSIVLIDRTRPSPD